MAASRTFWKYVFIPLLINALLLGHLASSDARWYGLKPLVQRLECLLGWRPNLTQGLEQRFPEGSAVAQRLVEPSASESPAGAGLRDEATDTPGWRQYMVPEGKASQTLVFQVETDREELLFLPRASGPDSGVEVAVLSRATEGATAGAKGVSLVAMRGKQEAWTPISALYRIPLACQDRDKPLVLRVTLSGPWAQLWHKDGQVFF